MAKKKPNGYWHNYENCYNEAKKYTTRDNFQRQSGGAYDIARRNDWLKDYTWFESPQQPKGYWNDYKNCYDAAKKCKTKSEFIHKCPAAYRNAKINGWLKDYIWFEIKERPKGYWNYDNCFTAAKDCNTRSEFKTKYNRAYHIARKNGWLEEYTWFVDGKNKDGYWDN